MQNGLEDARSLQELVNILLKATTKHNTEMSVSHETALEVVTRRVQDEMEPVITALASALSSSASLQNHLVGCSTDTLDTVI